MAKPLAKLLSMLTPKRRWLQFSLGTFAVLGIGLIWFVGVDLSWFVDDCDSCGQERDVIQYRFFTIPIHGRIEEHPTLVQFVADDLGIPCTHSKRTRWHKHRWWGLVYCACPCINILRMGPVPDRDEYETDLAPRVRARRTEDPQFPDEFKRRVLMVQDREYFWQLVHELREKEDIASERTH